MLNFYYFAPRIWFSNQKLAVYSFISLLKTIEQNKLVRKGLRFNLKEVILNLNLNNNNIENTIKWLPNPQ